MYDSLGELFFQGGVSKRKQKVSMVAIKAIDHDNFTKVFS
jgi:hypothetical protein